MAKVLTTTETTFDRGRIDLDFRQPDTWPEYFGGRGLPILFGDETAGPFAFVSAFPPMDEQMPLSFSHAHASDNWRISVRGTTNMGRDAYELGQFRFHDGGAPYASDNVAWGPDGGFGLIMFGDRRGFPIQPVKAEIAERVAPDQARAAERLGITPLDPCPGAPAIATTLGPTERAHRNGGFESAATWPTLEAGARGCVGLLGEPDVGPVVLLIDADPGAVVLPERRVDAELLLAPVTGSVHDGDGDLDQGSLRLEEAGHPQPRLVAGASGARVAAIYGDRRAVRAALDGGAFDGPDFAAGLDRELTRLHGLVHA